MNPVRPVVIALLLIAQNMVFAGKNPHNVFTIETKDDVSSHYFLEDGKYFFVRADDILYFFNGESVKEIWNSKLEDFEKV